MSLFFYKCSEKEKYFSVAIANVSKVWTIVISMYICRYCKRGYFRWGEISRKYGQDISRGGYFCDTFHISLIKSYWFYFRVGEISMKKVISRKTRKLPSCENFHLYSIMIKLFPSGGDDGQALWDAIGRSRRLYITDGECSAGDPHTGPNQDSGGVSATTPTAV